MKMYASAEELIGNTPLLEFTRLEKKENLAARIAGKLEYFNPAGSVKDRVAASMITAAEKSGQLQPGGVLIEPTSGNTGIGLAALAAAKGYKFVAVMPETMSKERRQLMKAYGAEIVLTPGNSGMKGAIAKAEELVRTTPGAIMPGQFVNNANPEAHRSTTGPEIWADTSGQINIFVAGVGTGGTITGVGEYLKSQNPKIEIVAIEPQDSPVLSKGHSGSHKIQGIGAGFVPEILNTDIYDKVLPISYEAARDAARVLARTQGILVGISSGAALAGALHLAKQEQNNGKLIVALLPDGGERYLSTELYAAAGDA